MEKLITLPSDINIHWMAIAPLLSIRNEEEYNQAIERMNVLIDEVGTNEEHPLYYLLDTLGTLIQVYEEEYVTIPDCDGNDMLSYLIDQHGLNLSDLSEIGTSETIEAILTKKQFLTSVQIKKLAERFQVSQQVFLDKH